MNNNTEIEIELVEENINNKKQKLFENEIKQKTFSLSSSLWM